MPLLHHVEHSRPELGTMGARSPMIQDGGGISIEWCEQDGHYQLTCEGSQSWCMCCMCRRGIGTPTHKENVDRRARISNWSILILTVSRLLRQPEGEDMCASVWMTMLWPVIQRHCTSNQKPSQQFKAP